MICLAVTPAADTHIYQDGHLIHPDHRNDMVSSTIGTVARKSSREGKEPLRRMGKNSSKKSKAKKVKREVKVNAIAEGVSGEVAAQESLKTRNFEGDLETYLQNWEIRNEPGATWKFNKNIQAWAMSNALNKEKIGSKLFKRLLPYLATVQGGAKTRLLESTQSVLVESSSDILADKCDDSEKALIVKRALKIQKLFSNE